MKREKGIAIITARGGSKRIPRKNIREFCGKPILAYPIEAALKSCLFDEVMVSTDDVEIGKAAERYGAEVPFFRSENTSDDHATTVDVLLEVLEEYGKRGRQFAYVCCIYPTAPFITEGKIRLAMELLEDGDTEAVMPVTVFSFSPMRGMYVREGVLSYREPRYAQSRSQDLETVYHDCGQFYCIKAEVLKRERRLVTEHTKAVIFPESEVQDIDTEEDWMLAEMKYRFMVEKK